MRRGFTLVEIVATVALLMLIVGFGYLFSFTYFKTQQLRATSDIVVSELRQAQANSFTQTNDASHGVKVFADRVVRFQGASYAARDPSKDIQTDFSTSFTLSGASEIVFSSGALTPAATGTITLSHESLAIDIVVSAYGVITQTERTIGG